jgi:hypothetical protein
LEYIQHASQAQIIGYAPVHQMEIRVFNAIIELPQFLQALQNSRDRPRRFGDIRKLLKPGRFSVAATAAVVVDRYR